MELEARRVLSADFALGVGGFVLDGFDAETNTLTITQSGDEYLFTLSAGDWNGVAAPGVIVSGQTLRVSVEAIAPLAEGLTVNATQGLPLDVTFGDVDFSGLSGSVQVIGATSIGQVGEASVAAPEASVLALVAPTEGTTITGGNFSGPFLAMANGPIIDADDTDFMITGDATFISRPGATPLGDIDLNGVIDAADVALWADGFGMTSGAADVNNDALVSAADFTALRDLAGTTGSGGIFLANHPDDEFIITGKATFIAQSGDASARFHISVGVDDTGARSMADAVEFGSLSLFGGDAKIWETNATVLDDSDVGSLALTSESSITDTGTTDVVVAGLASFDSIDDSEITLDDIYRFGSLQFDGGMVTIVEQDDTVLVGFSRAETSLSLSSGGTITDDGTGPFTVQGNASFTSTTGEAITLDDLNYAFVSLTVNGGDTTIVDSNDTQFVGTSLVASLRLDSAGEITDSLGDDGTTELTVLGNAYFNSTIDDDIVLDDTHNFGSLTFDAGTVSIDEASGTVLSGTSSASMLDLESTGAILDDGTADVTIQAASSFISTGNGNAFFDSLSDSAITLDDTYRFDSLTFDGGAVFIREADATELSGFSNADSLRLESAGSITQGLGAVLLVTGNASFTALNDDLISLGFNPFPTLEFGSLTFNGGIVEIFETGALVLSGVSSAAQLTLMSTATITDDGAADVDVTGNASFTATGSAITLDDTYDFGTLTFNGGVVTIIEDSHTVLSGSSNFASALSLSSNGSISDDGTVALTVLGNASFTSIPGDAITLDNTYFFGSLTFNGGDVTIIEANATLLSGTSLAGTLDLTALGFILDDGTADVTVLGNASFTSIGTLGARRITLTDDESDSSDNDVYNFGTLTFNGGEVEIKEASSTELAGESAADDLYLKSLGSITDTADAKLFVASSLDSDAVLEADGAIVLADSNAADADTENIIAILNGSYNAGLGAAPGDSVALGVLPDGSSANASLFANLLNFNAPGGASFSVDANITPPLTPPAVASSAATDLAFENLEDADLDLLAEDGLAVGV